MKKILATLVMLFVSVNMAFAYDATFNFKQQVQN